MDLDALKVLELIKDSKLVKLILSKMNIQQFLFKHSNL